ncbi:MAG: sugar phosphate isomerase/epimerase [Bacillota bacterium]|nr:sugar phosphate isomerase/epimerase [Bacillota bacterium]
MRLSTSTNLFGMKRFSEEYTPYIECLHRCHKAGFRVMDANFCPVLEIYNVLNEENWKDYILRLREESDSLGMEFTQSHLPIYCFYPNGREIVTMEQFMTLTERSIIASSILGVKWAILHAITDVVNNQHDNAQSKKTNHEFYSSVIEFAKKHNVGIAIENMAEFSPQKMKRRYTATTEELIDLVDSFNDKDVQICWDFGHGNLMYNDQCASLLSIGKRLKATHVDDNRANHDAHLPPFFGTVNWEKIMPVLKQIGYEGDFTYEIHGLNDRMPDVLKDEAAKFSYDIGMYCLSLADK